ncbi:MAG TPA: M48 family metallopeptidase [Blastocatellia bacterium]|nr:M48 family metallopeptidase [Blastocatellia bacterium]
MISKRRNSPRIFAVVIVSALFVNVLAQSNPYDKYRKRTHSNRGYLSEEDELKLAEQVHQELMKQTRLVQNRSLNEYVNSVGQRLARNSGRPDIPWRFYVVDDKSINAFATLGGRVYVHTGLLAATDSESQLASVLGHEIGHIVARHGLENVKKSQRAGLYAGLAAIAGAVLGGQAGADLGGAVGNLIGGGFLMKHSRNAEREADYLGLYDLKDSGYNTGGMVEMFEILQEVSASSPGAFGSILASHPAPSERAANTRREISQHLRGSDRRGLRDTEDFQRLKSGFQSQSSSSPRRTRPRN